MPELKIRIRQLALRLRISPQSIRNYEDQGLFPEPQKDENGWRYYTEDDVNKIIAYYFTPSTAKD